MANNTVEKNIPASSKSFTESKRFLVETHLNEYGQLRKEVVELLSQKSNSINYSLVVLAALITLLPSAVTNFGGYVLLVATIPFFGLTWYIISIDSLIARIGQYLRTVLIPKVSGLIVDEDLEKTGISLEAQTVLDWERYTSSFAEGGLNNAITILITSGRNVLVFGPIPVLIGIFFYLTRVSQPRPWSMVEQGLLWGNIIGVVGLSFLGLLVRRQFAR